MPGIVSKTLLAGAATLALGLHAAGASAETRLTYGSYLPATHVIHTGGLEPFFKRVEEDTNGSLKWELFSGGSMGGPKEALQTIEDNVVDSAIIVDVYIKREVPVSVAIADVGLLADDPMVFAAATNEAYLLNCPQCDAETERHNKVALARYTTGIYNIMCTSPIHTLEGLQGVKVRVGGRHGVLMKELGATPVSVTTAEMYEAMQRGQAECTTGSPAWLNSYGLKDVVKGIVNYPIGAYIGGEGMNMNADRWNSLSDDERMAIRKNLPKLVSDLVFAYVAEGEAAQAEALQNGVQLLEPDDALKNAIDEFRKGEVQVSIEKAREAGVDNPEKVLDSFLASVDKWRKIVADIGRDRAKYEEALWQEIFSKVQH